MRLPKTSQSVNRVVNDNLETLNNLKTNYKASEIVLLETWWNIKDTVSNPLMTKSYLQKNYNLSRQIVVAIRKIDATFTSLSEMIEEFKKSEYNSASKFLQTRVGINHQKAKSLEYYIKNIKRQFDSARDSYEGENLKYKLMDRIRRYVDSQVPPKADVSDRQAIAYGSCCGCGSNKIPPQGFLTMEYEGFPVPLCDDCWGTRRVDIAKAYKSAIKYIAQLERINKLLSGA